MTDTAGTEPGRSAHVSEVAAALVSGGLGDAVASAVLTALPLPLVVVDAGGTIVRVNEAWNRLAEQQSGQPVRRAHVGSAYSDVCRALATRAADAVACAQALQSVLQREQASAAAPLAAQIGGRMRHWQVQAVATTVPAGGAVVLHLEQPEAPASADAPVPAAPPEGLWLLDAAGRTTFVNHHVAEFLGCAPADMLGQAAYLFLDHASIAAFHAALQRLRQGAEEEVQLKLRRRDGTLRWAIGRVTPLAHPDGSHAGARVTLEDATASHTAEERLRSALDALQSVVAASPLAITTCDASGRVARWNAAATRLFGWTEAEAIGHVLPPVPPELAEEDQRLRDAALAGSLLTGRETVRLARDGTRVQVSVSLSPMHERDGRAKGVVLVYDDIGPRKRAEVDVLRASRIQATAKLAGGVAHDVNNLMAGILGNAELLRGDLEHLPEVRPVLDDIADAAMRAGALAQQLLAYARGGRYRPETLDLNRVVSRVVSDEEQATQAPARVRIALADTPWPVLADQSQMAQLVSHLVANAFEATAERGDVTVSTANVELSPAWAAARPGATAGPHVRLSVRDTGVGMDAATLEHAFEPFFTTKTGARGLGLAAAFGIVKSHGGYVHAESAAGEGTLLEVYLPAAVRPAAPDAAAPAAASELPRGTETLLVVDDEPAVRDVMKKLLERLGYTVEVAAGGAEAIARVEREPTRFALVILDMRMPVVNGPAAFRRMREVAPGLRILIATGFERDEDAQSLLDEGAVGFLQKPFEQARLALEVRRSLAH